METEWLCVTSLISDIRALIPFWALEGLTSWLGFPLLGVFVIRFPGNPHRLHCALAPPVELSRLKTSWVPEIFVFENHPNSLSRVVG